MRPLQCPQCGANLPASEDERLVCEFCGTALAPTRQLPVADLVATLRRRGGQMGAEGVPRLAETAARTAVSVARTILIAVAVFLALIGVLVGYIVRTTTRDVVGGLRAAVPKIQIQSAGPLKLADLSTSHFTGREVPVDVAPPQGGFDSVDAAVNLPWALTIAQAWQRDVRLDRADVERMRPDGTVNCRDDAEAEVLYRFVSPGRIQEFERQSDLVRNVEGTWEFWVTVKQGQVLVRTLTGRSLPSDVERFTGRRAAASGAGGDAVPVPPFPAAPPLRQTIAAASRQPRWVAKPFYNAYMLFNSDEGWVWYVSGLAGRDNIPRIRASDGRMYPYNR